MVYSEGGLIPTLLLHTYIISRHNDQRRSHGGILGILGSPREPHGPQEYGPRAIDEVIGRREACFREW